MLFYDEWAWLAYCQSSIPLGLTVASSVVYWRPPCLLLCLYCKCLQYSLGFSTDMPNLTIGTLMKTKYTNWNSLNLCAGSAFLGHWQYMHMYIISVLYIILAAEFISSFQKACSVDIQYNDPTEYSIWVLLLTFNT